MQQLNESGAYYTKWSKSQRQIPYDTTYMWNLKYDTNGLIFKLDPRT